MNSKKYYIDFIFIPKLDKMLRLNVELEISNFSHDFQNSALFCYTNSFIENDYYTESFIIYSGSQELYKFRMNIYYGIKNSIVYDIEEKNAPTFEMLFYGKEYLPYNISYKNYKLNNFETNNNKFRKRLCIANANPNELEFIKNCYNKKLGFAFSEESYQVLIRISNSKEIKYSLTPIKKQILSKKKEIIINEKDIELLKLFKEYYEIFIEEINKINEENIKEKEDELQSCEELINSYYSKIIKSKIYGFLFNPFNYKNIENSLEIIHLYFFFYEYEILNNDKESIITEIMLSIEYIIKNNMIENKVYELLKNDNSYNEKEKIKILQTVINIIVKSINNNSYIKDINYIKINNLPNNNPYYKAISLIDKIISNLREESRLFEPFLYFNSGTIKNYLIKDNNTSIFTYKNILGEIQEYKNEQYISEYGLNLLNIEQIKKILKNLIPNIIIRIETNMKFKAYFDKDTNIMLLNELVMFKKNIIQMNIIFKEGKKSDYYIIPITIEIFHENMAHGKLRDNNKTQKSPRHYSDSKYGFQYKNIIKNIETEFGENRVVPIPESGRVLENYISENKKIINALKTPCKENMELLNYIYWIGTDFQFLEKEVLETIEILGEDNILTDEEECQDIYEGCFLDRSNT